MFIEASESELEQSRRLNEVVEQVLGALPSVHTVDPVVTRRERAEGGGVMPAPVLLDVAEDRVVPGPAGDIGIRVLVPDQVDAVYLHLHGGGWVLGSARGQDEPLWALARATNMAVVSVEYRLAPEHPFPAGPDDCEHVARWLLDGGAADLGATSIVIGGESAGAHLSVVTLLRLHDAGVDLSPIVGANLVYGAYDLGGTPSQRRWGERNLILSGPIMEWFYSCALPGLDVEQRRDPAWSPLYADLNGMPPALFIVGALDPLVDDSMFMADRWRAAGGSCEVAVFPESIHAFNAFPSDLAARAGAMQVAFIREAIGGRAR